MSNVVINGQQYDSGSLTLPASGRLFRSAWDTPSGGVVQLDVDAVADLCHAKRQEWRAMKDREPFPHAADTFDKDADSRDRIAGLLQMSNVAQAQATTVEALLASQGAPTTFTSATSQEHPINDLFAANLFMDMAAHTASVHGANMTKAADIETARAGSDISTLQSIMEGMIAELEAS